MRLFANKFTLSSALLLCCVAPSAIAVPVTYNFTGVATSARGIFEDQGTAVSGFFSFDDGLVDDFIGPAVDRFVSESNPSLIGSFSASLTIGSVTVTGAAESFAELRLEDHDSSDLVEYALVGSDSAFGFMLTDIPLGGIPDGVAAGSENLTDSIADAIAILDHLDLGSFVAAQGTWSQLDSVSQNWSTVAFTMTGIERAVAVPEPTTVTLLLAGILGMSRIRRRTHSPGSA